MGSSWTNRGTYGRILKKLIQRQVRRFETEKESEEAIDLAHNIGYLISIERDLIKDNETSSFESRIEQLEKNAGL